MNLNETKICIRCNIEKSISSFQTDKRGTRNVCISCRKHHNGLAQKGRKKWLSEGKEIPSRCQLCGKKTKVVWDHDHNTEKFRGWLCHQCNQGIGFLGDNISGLENAIRYLKESKLK